MQKMLISVPMGDPAGVGAEIIIKALKQKEITDIACPIIIGDLKVIKKTLKFCNCDLKINSLQDINDASLDHGIINLFDLNNINENELAMGKVQAKCGRAAFQYIEFATKLAMEKKVSAMATTPINKESLKEAGVNFIGHTEILAALSGVQNPLTMFQVLDLRVFFLSRHVSLRQACDLVTKENVFNFIKECSWALEKIGFKKPFLAVAGLNPHNGEHGMFGCEEVEAIEPAVKLAKEKGFNVVGPISADAVFHFGKCGKYDAVLSLYHDQGHIATKTLDFEKTISVTHGLPFLRTSVDHGTAFDIAGQGIASAVSMVETIKIATNYALILEGVK